jgi:hypothetical protein
VINTTRILSDTLNGKTIHRLDTNQNHKPDADEPVLVQRTQDGWQPATGELGQVKRRTMEDAMGFWTDKQVSHKEGWFWNREEVVDRPKNGTIENDEVSTSGFTRTGDGLNGPNRYELGAEIVKDSDGALFLDEHSITYGSRRIIGEGDIQRMQSYIDSDDNWIVKQNPVLIGSAEGPFAIGSGSTTITVPINWDGIKK